MVVPEDRPMVQDHKELFKTRNKTFRPHLTPGLSDISNQSKAFIPHIPFDFAMSPDCFPMAVDAEMEIRRDQELEGFK